MGKQRWKKWVMAAAIAGMLAGQTGFLTVWAAEMPGADAVVETLEEISAEIMSEQTGEGEEPAEETQGQEAEVSAPAEAPEEVGLSDNMEEVTAQSSGITWTVDGDTVIIIGEGTMDSIGVDIWNALDSAKHVRFENCKIIGSMFGFFYERSNIESIDLSGLDTSNVTNMSGMFFGCSSLTSVDLSGIDTSNVTDMYNMFDGCNSLTSVDVSGFDTSNVTDMSYMFSYCSSLTSVDVSGFDTSNVTGLGMGSMFLACSSLTSVDLSGIDTSNVTYMGYMFSGCSSLTSVDLSGIDTSNVTDMSGMFYGCSSLTSVDLSGIDTSNVTSMGNMFYGCSSLTSVDVSGFDTGNVELIFSMFSGCRSLTSLDLSNFDMRGVGYYSYDRRSKAENMLSDTDIIVLKTPRALGSAPIDLPATFVDPSGKETDQVTAEFCNTTLTRKGAVVPTPTPVPTPVPTPKPTPIVDEQTRINVSNFTERMYTVALGRSSDPEGQENWTSLLLSHETDGAGIAHGFIMSEEFEKRNLSNGDFIDVLYRTFFNREADAGGRATWMAELAAGSSRGYVLSGFVNSVEFDNLCDSYGIVRGTMREDGSPCNPGIRSFVERCYTKVLGRAGEKVGIEDWTNRITTGQMSAEDVAKSFFFSDEYTNKNTNNETFVETLYQTFMDRASDPAGKSDWVGRLNGGTSRQEVLEGFSKSTEFAAILAGYGL